MLECNLKSDRMISVHFQGKPYNITVYAQMYASNTNAKAAEVELFYEDLRDLPDITLKKDVIFIKRDWKAKAGGQGIPEVTGEFGLQVQNEQGQRLTEFCQENTLLIANSFFQQHKRQLGHHQMVKTKIRLIVF